MLLLGLSASPLPVSGSLKRVVHSVYDWKVKEYLITDMKYGLTDEVVHSYNDFCQDLAIMSTSVPKNLHSNATLYLLSQHPPRTDHETISGISKQMSFSGGGSRAYYSYILDMNAGTSVVINACYLVSDADAKIEFYLLKGTKNFNKWVDDWIFHSGSYIEKHLTLTSTCQTISYHAQKTDKYYFVFYKDPFGDNMKADFQVDRPVYHVSSDTVVNSCTIPLDGESSCSLSIPMSSGYTALMSLHASLPIDYPDGADISIKCQPRGWLYAIVVISALVGTILSAALLVAIARTVLKRRKKLSTYVPVRSLCEPTHTSRGMSEDSEQNENIPISDAMKSETVPASCPPPYNPAYSGHGYGSTLDNDLPSPYSEI